jgi:putative chitinase
LAGKYPAHSILNQPSKDIAMLAITAAQVRAAAKSPVNDSNLNSVMVALDRFADGLDINKPHILAQLFAQLMHESGDFRHDGEIWGPTAAQKRYDTRTDLGNTPAADGDGYLYRGRTGMQITGKDNYRQFTTWCRKRGYNPPDFVARPELVNTDPWEGLVPLWYWDTRGLNRWANQGDAETITKKINGGKNGLADRFDRLARVSLVLLGYRADNVLQFQADQGLEVDGDVGPKTRAALHSALVALTPGEMARPEVKSAPVTEETTVTIEKPVVPVAVDDKVKGKTNQSGWLIGILGSIGTALTGLFGQDWQTVVAVGAVTLVALVLLIVLRHQIIAAVRDIRGAIEQ